MGTISLSIPQTGQPDATEEPKITNDLTLIQTLLNGRLDTNNFDPAAGITAAQLASAITQAAGVNDGTTVRSGKSIIATSESLSSTSYGLMATPDRVQNVVLPTDGLILVAYHALWRQSTQGSALAALFLGSNQVVGSTASISPGDVSVDHTLASCGVGLTSSTQTGGVASTVVTTGQVVGSTQVGTPNNYMGGACLVFAAAGTYDVSVRFAVDIGSGGIVTARSRKLWVRTYGF